MRSHSIDEFRALLISKLSSGRSVLIDNIVVLPGELCTHENSSLDCIVGDDEDMRLLENGQELEVSFHVQLDNKRNQ